MTIGINGTFKDFSTAKPSQAYAENSAAKNTPSAPLASISLEDFREVQKNYGKEIALSLLGAGILGLFFARGFSGFNKTFARKFTELKEKLAASSFKKSSDSIVSKTIVKVQKGMVQAFNFLNATSNLNALKDSFSTKILRSNSITAKMAEKINGFFKKIAINASDKTYKNISGMQEDLISTATKYLGKDSEKLIAEAQTLYNQGFSRTVRDQRLATMEKATENLYEKVSNELKSKSISDILKNWKDYQSYITTDLIATERKSIQENLLRLRRNFTNEPYHNIDDMRDALSKITLSTKSPSKEFFEKINNLEQQINKFKLAETNDAKNKIAAEINKKLNNLNIHLGENAESQNLINQVKQALQRENEHTGMLQKLLSKVELKYGKTSPEYKDFKLQVNKISKNLDQAIESEGVNLFEKLAEIEVGSAPTDILGLLLPVGLAGYYISQSEDKDEKIGTAMKTGIPIIGGLAMTLVGTIKMYSSIKSILLGVGSGWLLSLMGDWANDKYLATAENKHYINEQLAKYGIDPKNKNDSV